MPGSVDFLTELDGATADEVEDCARLMFDFDWAAGDRIDIEEIDDAKEGEETQGMADWR